MAEELGQVALARALKAAIAKAAKAEEARFKALHPNAERLKVKAEIIAFKPRGVEQKRVPHQAVALMLRDRKTIDLSNKELLDAVVREFGTKVPAAILTERFDKRARERVAEMLAHYKVAIDLSEHDTPSKVKLALRAHRAGGRAVSKRTVTFAFTSDTITVDDKAYPIHQSGALRRIDVRSKKLNADVLQRLIMGGE